MTYDALSEILENVKAQPDIQASPKAQDKINLALSYLRDCQDDIQKYSDGYVKMYEELAAFKLDEMREEAGERFNRVFTKYQWIHQAGGDANLIDRVAKAEGLSSIFRMKILRTLFQLSLQEAMEIVKLSDQHTNAEI